MEWAKQWVSPGVIIAMVGFAFTGTSWINGIDGRVAQNAKAIASNDSDIAALQVTNGTTASRLAVVETQLDNVVKLLERIDSRMEAQRGG